MILCWVTIAAVPVRSQRLFYTIDARELAEHRVHVTLRPIGFSRDTSYFQMAAWTPGAYSATHYGRFIAGFNVVDTNRQPIAFRKISPDRWEIYSNGPIGQIEYDVMDSHADSTSLFFALARIDTSVLFANGTALYGYVNDHKQAPATVTFHFPPQWQFATPLQPTGDAPDPGDKARFTHLYYNASDFDDLADAPVLAARRLQTATMWQGSTPYDVVLVSDAKLAVDSLGLFAKKIVHLHSAFFGDVPPRKYMFMFYAPPASTITDLTQGALAHASSSAYLIGYTDWQAFRRSAIDMMSHEFFHLWNGKKIHSSLMSPIDYTTPIRTSSLWFTEGVTDYYASLLLSRSGMASIGNFEKDIDDWIDGYLESETAFEESLEDLSKKQVEFDVYNATAFFDKGPIVGMLLDIEIRNRTGNKRSLDNVLRTMNKQASQGRTFSDAALIHDIEQAAGIDLTEFHDRYIAGADTLPIEAYFRKLVGAPRIALPEALEVRNELAFDLTLNAAAKELVEEIPADADSDYVPTLKPPVSPAPSAPLAVADSTTKSDSTIISDSTVLKPAKAPKPPAKHGQVAKPPRKSKKDPAKKPRIIKANLRTLPPKIRDLRMASEGRSR